jgi:hypothetical protein
LTTRWYLDACSTGDRPVEVTEARRGEKSKWLNRMTWPSYMANSKKH